MSIERKNIRHELVALLKRKKTSAGNNVFSSRSTPVWQENLPAIMIYPRTEDVEKSSESPRQYKHTLIMAFDLVADGRDDDAAADKMDELDEQVQRILGVDETLNCLVNEISLISSEFDYEERGQKSIMSMTLVYEIEYYVFSPKDRRDQDVKDFTSITANWDIGTANDPDHEATDDITLPA